MNFEQLDAFVTVATEGGFTRASAALHRTQPAVTRRVQQLERDLGVRLFERRGRDTFLTPEGELFLPYAVQVLTTLRDGVSVVSGETPTGPLRVALVGTLADEHLAEALRDFSAARDSPDIRLRTATSREVSELVRRGEADLGIRYFMDRRPGVENIALGDDRLHLVCAANHPLAGKTLHKADRVVDEKWLTFPFSSENPDSFGELLLRALLRLGISEPDVTVVDSLTAQKRLAQAGYGLALLPKGSCEDEFRSGSLATITVKGFTASQPVFAIRRTSTRQRVEFDAFLEALKYRSLRYR
ncbi:MAG: LysR family transcriptional regulator [Pseudomonadales bacterium]|nr:LysR family transcriptional regulator [Pseudomonadales bacterium]